MSFIPFNSRDINSKSPFGATSAGENIHFKVAMPRDMHVSAVSLVFESEENSYENSLFWTGTDGLTEWWQCDIAPENAGIYFYYFTYETPWGRSNITLSQSGCGQLSGDGDMWQQTVCARDFHTCDKIKGGIIYQIFPDRFYRSGKPKIGVPGDRIIHNDTHELPVWEPDENGEILNNDYFGGDLPGITEKLPYIASLGVSCIYLNPIFEAHSNHRYDTADYLKIDPLLGDENDFKMLCDRAHKLGISVILDGVFSHTGADSIYFNKNLRYGTGGAYNDENSPYRRWYTFDENGGYESWWGFKTLPEVRETEPSYCDFITGENGVIHKWMQLGADGFRLDVADELPDEFIEKIRTAVKREKPDAYLLGEVWEDASNKISFGVLRRYFLGTELDSVMNYPFANAITDFVTGGTAESFTERIVTICENYPKEALHTAMNHLGTHDTGRILTVLSGAKLDSMDRRRQAELKILPHDLEKAKRRLRAAAVLQYTLPGVPSVYYGDEAGLCGGKDPFNRRFFPWDEESPELLDFYKKLGEVRRSLPALRYGDLVSVSAMLGCVCFFRDDETEKVIVISNMNTHGIDYTLPPFLGGKTVHINETETKIFSFKDGEIYERI